MTDQPASGLPKLQAVARAAGVSVSTVSKVLNGRPDVAPATRTRVAELLGRAGYSEVGSRRSGTGNGNGNLVEVVANRLDDPLTSRLLRAVCLEANARGRGVVVTDAGTAGGRAGHHPPRGWLDAVDARGAGAVISLLMEFSDAQLSYFEAHGVAVCVMEAMEAMEADARGADSGVPGGATTAALPWDQLARAALDLVSGDRRGVGTVIVPPGPPDGDLGGD